MTRIAWRLVSMLADDRCSPLTDGHWSSRRIQKEVRDPPAPVHDPQIGQSFQVPYRLTDTNHFLVRARINGKGPFNFLVDSGAPAFFIATETAKKIGLKPAADEFWTPVDRLDLEGGSRLTGIKARVEDPFPARGDECPGSSRCVDRWNSRVHDSGTVSPGDRSDQGSDDLDPSRSRSTRSTSA